MSVRDLHPCEPCPFRCGIRRPRHENGLRTPTRPRAGELGRASPCPNSNRAAGIVPFPCRGPEPHPRFNHRGCIPHLGEGIGSAFGYSSSTNRGRNLGMVRRRRHIDRLPRRVREEGWVSFDVPGSLRASSPMGTLATPALDRPSTWRGKFEPNRCDGKPFAESHSANIIGCPKKSAAVDSISGMVRLCCSPRPTRYGRPHSVPRDPRLPDNRCGRQLGMRPRGDSTLDFERKKQWTD